MNKKILIGLATAGLCTINYLVGYTQGVITAYSNICLKQVQEKIKESK